MIQFCLNNKCVLDINTRCAHRVMSSRTIWGPKIWYMLHRLSFFSDRSDLGGAWKNVLRNLSETMPCTLCRKHMKDYLAANPIKMSGLSGPEFRDMIVMWLFKFHNHVNASRGASLYDFDQMAAVYGQRVHIDAVSDAKQVLIDIDNLWKPQRPWNEAMRYLTGLIGGGSLP